MLPSCLIHSIDICWVTGMCQVSSGPGARKTAVNEQNASPCEAHILVMSWTYRSEIRTRTEPCFLPLYAKAAPQSAQGTTTSEKVILPALASKGNVPILAAGRYNTHSISKNSDAKYNE